MVQNISYAVYDSYFLKKVIHAYFDSALIVVGSEVGQQLAAFQKDWYIFKSNE